MNRIYKISKLINCKLPTITSPNHINLLLYNSVFCIAKTRSCKDRIFGDIGQYIKLKEKPLRNKKELEYLISQNLKRHNGHRLVLLVEGNYAIIYPKGEIIRLGSMRSKALAFWYNYWKQTTTK